MPLLSRKDHSLISRWWWRIDRPLLSYAFVLSLIGLFLNLAASPSIAQTLNLPSFYFASKHLIFMSIGYSALFITSLQNPRTNRLICWIAFIVSLILLIITHLKGAEIKGAKRWITFIGITIQPSEVAKTAFLVLSAWVLSLKSRNRFLLSFLLYLTLAPLILLQPDLGMTIVVSCSWFCQLIIAGFPLMGISIIGFLGGAGFVIAYFTLPHVHARVDKFLYNYGDQYQIERSLESFRQGGFFGRGPGEGFVKHTLPDAHSDFIFSVAGEEFGLLVCFLIIGLFIAFVRRSIHIMRHETHLFLLLGTSGLVLDIAIKAIINMASAVHLIPTKGMTLPFISYGGSSLVASAWSVGIILSFTKLRSNERGII